MHLIFYDATDGTPTVGSTTLTQVLKTFTADAQDNYRVLVEAILEVITTATSTIQLVPIQIGNVTQPDLRTYNSASKAAIDRHTVHISYLTEQRAAGDVLAVQLAPIAGADAQTTVLAKYFAVWGISP